MSSICADTLSCAPQSRFSWLDSCFLNVSFTARFPFCVRATWHCRALSFISSFASADIGLVLNFLLGSFGSVFFCACLLYHLDECIEFFVDLCFHRRCECFRVRVQSRLRESRGSASGPGCSRLPFVLSSTGCPPPGSIAGNIRTSFRSGAFIKKRVRLIVSLRRFPQFCPDLATQFHSCLFALEVGMV